MYVCMPFKYLYGMYVCLYAVQVFVWYVCVYVCMPCPCHIITHICHIITHICHIITHLYAMSVCCVFIYVCMPFEYLYGMPFKYLFGTHVWLLCAQSVCCVCVARDSYTSYILCHIIIHTMSHHHTYYVCMFALHVILTRTCRFETPASASSSTSLMDAGSYCLWVRGLCAVRVNAARISFFLIIFFKILISSRVLRVSALVVVFFFVGNILFSWLRKSTISTIVYHPFSYCFF
jgi:hypothetical protein